METKSTRIQKKHPRKPSRLSSTRSWTHEEKGQKHHIRKIIGNSSYEYQIMNRSKHSKTQHVAGDEVDELVNHHKLKSLNVLPLSIYGVKMEGFSQQGNTTKPSLLDSFTYIMPNSKCRNFSINSFNCSLIHRSRNHSKWIQTVFIWLSVKIRLRIS